MILITESEAKAYELLKTRLTPDDIAKSTGLCRKSVIEHLNTLWKNGLVNKHGHFRTGYTYTTNDLPYQLHKRTKVNRSKRVPKNDNSESIVIVKLTPEQEKVIAENRDKNRSVLAKLAGISKSNLNFYLERKKMA